MGFSACLPACLLTTPCQPPPLLQGGMLDSEAACRCTTVYLVDRRLDMLPALLSEDLCSLRCNQGAPAWSCVMLCCALRAAPCSGFVQHWSQCRPALGCWYRKTAHVSPTALPHKSSQHPVLADRYAVSVLWTLDADSFEVLDVWYGRTVIRQAASLVLPRASCCMLLLGACRSPSMPCRCRCSFFCSLPA